jgi:hypothetical protein
MSWPTSSDGKVVDPVLKEKWDEFLSECDRLGSTVRNVEYSLMQNPERAYIMAEVQRLGDDYGEVYWHGYLDEKDSWGSKFSDSEEEEQEIVCGGWGSGTATKHIPLKRPGSPCSDRGLDKVGWFRVVAHSTGIAVLQGMCFWEQDPERYFQEKCGYYYSTSKPCAPLDDILRLPGPGTLAYEWVGTRNPMWH